MRRLWLRRVRGDDGLSLVETVAALIVFALIMSGLAAGMTLFAHTTAYTKIKNAATSLAQQTVEAAKIIPVNQLTTCSGDPATPASTTFQGTAMTVLTGTTPCLPYSQTRSSNGVTFTVTQLVVTKTDNSWKVTVGNQPIIQKQLIVTVSWTAQTPGSYTTNTLMSGKDALTAQTPVGLRVNINDTTGTLVSATNLVWDYTVTNASGTVASGTTDDGTSGLLSLSPGTYTCSVVPEDDAGASYDPSTTANAGMTVSMAAETITGTCTVNANTIADWNTTWNEVTSCAASNTTGNLSITIKDQQGNAVNGAKVTLTNVGSSVGTVFGKTVNSDSNGIALFTEGNAPPADLYTYVISLAGYQTSDSLGPVCVAPTVTAYGSGTLQTLSTCAMSKVKGTVTMTVTDENDNPVSGAKVVLSNQDGQGSPGSVNTNASGVALFNNNVLGGNYNYTLSKTNYTTSTGTLCVTAATTNDVSGLLPTQGQSGCSSTSAKGSLVIKVTDQSGNPVSGAKVHLTNANGHGGTPGDKTTDATGTVTFSGSVPGDLFTYTLATIPSGYSDPGIQGPVCVIAGGTKTSQVALTGVMTVKVTVTNSDTQPTKSYNVILKDSSGRTTSNTTTINRTKSTTLTFSNMPTDTYTIEVCIPIATTGNCDDINNTATTYAFTTKGSTYQSPNPPTFVDAKGGS